MKWYHNIGTYIGLKIHGFVLLKWFVVWLHCKKDMELSHMIFRELIGGKCLCDTGIINWYIVYVCPLVKSLKPSRKTLRCGCMGLVLPLSFSPWRQVGKPLGMSPKRHGVWLALGWCPRIVIIILIEYLVEHWYLMCRLVGVSSLWLLKGWMRKSKDETIKHIHTCLTWLHTC